MIITAPTGSYKTQLPQDPLDPTSVIYTISSGLPERIDASFLRIPNGIRKKPREDRLFSLGERRRHLGDLVYVSKTTSPVRAADGSKPYSIGQILDFTTDLETPTIIPNPVGDEITTRHNSNYIDQARLGLSDSERLAIDTGAVAAQRKILDQVDTLQKRRSSLELDIANSKRIINEADKVISGLDTILSVDQSSDMVPVRIKLVAKRDMERDRMNSAIAELNEIPGRIRTLRDNLLALVELVK